MLGNGHVRFLARSGRGNVSDLPDKGSHANAGAPHAARGQSRSSGTAPGAPDRRDRCVAIESATFADAI
jgi:hypothetical protein